MHPSTMNQIGVSLGELVSVNDLCIVPVWPSWSLPLTCVSLGEGVIDCKQLGGEQFSSVHPLSTSPRLADELLIKEWYAFILKKVKKRIGQRSVLTLCIIFTTYILFTVVVVIKTLQF